MARKESNKAANGPADAIIPARTGYFIRTARAVYALVFLLPIIVLYEALVFLVNPQILNEPVSHVRGAVVSFIWVQNFLHYLGMEAKAAWLFAPAVIIVILLMLQLASRQSWKVRLKDFPVMGGECLIFAIPLVILSLVLNRVPSQQPSAVGNFNTVIVCSTDASGISEEGQTSRAGSNIQDIYIGLLTGIGAGIYEELIFRLILISLSMIFFETILGVRHIRAVIISVVISSVLFSLHHHFVFLDGQFTRTADMFTMTRFVFRTVAGVFFAIIFAVRGFGIAAGTHAFYDIIATLLNAWLFGQC